MVSLFLGVLAVVVVQAGAETAERAALRDIELTPGHRRHAADVRCRSDKTVPIVLDTLAAGPTRSRLVNLAGDHRRARA